MNVQSTVSKCTGCGALSTTKELNQPCDLKIETITLGKLDCTGHYVPTKGQLFRNLHGYSPTLKRNMRKHGLDIHNFSDSKAAYKAIRKVRKKKQNLLQKAKHDAALGHRKNKASGKIKK